MKRKILSLALALVLTLAVLPMTARAEDYYRIHVSSWGNGSVQGGGTYDSGASVTVKATPNSGYTFDGWYEYVSGGSLAKVSSSTGLALSCQTA